MQKWMVKFLLFSTNFLKSGYWSHHYLTFYWQFGISLFLFANKICLDLRKKLFQTIFILKVLISKQNKTVKLFLREAQKIFLDFSGVFWQQLNYSNLFPESSLLRKNQCICSIRSKCRKIFPSLRNFFSKSKEK